MKAYPKTLKLTVQVTDRDIQRGQPRNCLRCPLNLAIRRALRETGVTGLIPLVSGADILLRRASNNRRVYKVLSTQRVQDFIHRVDNHGIIRAARFTFTFKAAN